MISDLPVALVYGPYFGVALAIFAGALAVAIQRALAARRVRRAAARAWPEEPPHGLEPGERTVIGALVADGEVITLDRDDRPALVAGVELERELRVQHGARAAEGLAIVVDDERVTVEGPVACARGSREHRPGAHLVSLGDGLADAVVEEVGGDASKLSRPRFSTLREGDRVRAIGRLEREVGEADEGYRDAATRWVLRPGEDEVVWLAFDGAPSIAAPSRGRSAALALVTLALAFGALQVQGASFFDDPPYTSEDQVRTAPPWDDGRAQVASLSFAHHERVLGWCARETLAMAPFDEGLARRRVALERSSEGCAAAREAAREHGLGELALSFAAECPEEAEATHCDVADYRSAAARIEPPLWQSDLIPLLAAGELRRAAEGARARVETVRRGTAGQEPPELTGWSCIADALEARVGDSDARARLVDAAGDHRFCRLLLADLTEGEARLPLLDGLEGWVGEQAHALTLAAEVSPEAAAARLPAMVGLLPLAPVLAPGRPPRAALVGQLARLDAAELRDMRQLTLRGTLRLLRVVELAGQGRAEEAEALRADAETDLRLAIEALGAPSERPDSERATWREVTATLRTHAEGWRAVLEVERGLAPPPPPDGRLPYSYAMERIQRASLTGDGSEVVRAVGSRRTQLYDLVPILHRVETHRDALATHLRFARRGGLSSCAPLQLSRRYAQEARAARRLGDDEWREQALALARAQDEALRRRDVALVIGSIARARYVDVE